MEMLLTEALLLMERGGGGVDWRDAPWLRTLTALPEGPS